MIGKHNYSDKVMSTSAAEKISLVTGKYFVVKPSYHGTGIQRGVRSDWLSATLSAFIARLTKEPFAKRSFLPNSALCSKFYPRNINHMPVVKFLACLDFERKS
jgi:hypothetical protein